MIDVGSIHRSMFETVNNGDMSTLREMYHPDYVYRGPDGQTGDADAGVAVAESYKSAFPDLELSVVHQYTPEETTSIVEINAKGTHRGELNGIPPTGRTLDLVGCNVIEVADGKIIREREYYDSASVMIQLGVLEPPND